MSKDPSGTVSYRAWLFSTDADGKRFPAPGSECMRVRETKPHALSHPDAVTANEEAELEKAAVDRFRRHVLTDAEREVFDLQTEDKFEEQESFVDEETFKRLQLDPNLTLVNRLDAKLWRVTVRRRVQLSNEEIWKRLKITERQLRTRIQGINRKKRESGI